MKNLTLNKRMCGPNLHLMFKLHEIRSIGSQENFSNCCHQMSDFKAKKHQIRFRQHNLQRFPEPLAGFKGPTSKRRGGEVGDGKGGRERERGGVGRKGKGEGEAPLARRAQVPPNTLRRL